MITIILFTIIIVLLLIIYLLYCQNCKIKKDEQIIEESNNILDKKITDIEDFNKNVVDSFLLLKNTQVYTKREYIASIELHEDGLITFIKYYQNSENAFTLVLSSPEFCFFKSGNSYPCILGKIRDKIIIISDIQTGSLINHGYGSMLMRLLINYAKQNDIIEIRGILSSVDSDHIDRRKHFYEKFGFSVIEEKNGNGHICLKLDSACCNN